MQSFKIPKALLIIPNAWIMIVVLSFYLKLSGPNFQGIVEMTLIPAILFQLVMSFIILFQWIIKKAKMQWLWVINLLVSVHVILSFSGVFD